MCPDSRCLFLGWFLFWFRVCELVIPLMNKGVPRSAFYIIHDCPELSTAKYLQIRIEGIMNSSSEKWNPPHYTSNMKPWSQLMETYHHVAAQVNPADFIIDLVSVHSDGRATWMLLICDSRDGDALTSFRKLIPSWCMMLSMYSNAFGCVVHVFFRKIDGTVLSRLLISFLWGAFFPMPYFTVPSDPISMKYESGHVWGHWLSS